jgi:hypothetical protein
MEGEDPMPISRARWVRPAPAGAGLETELLVSALEEDGRRRLAVLCAAERRLEDRIRLHAEEAERKIRERELRMEALLEARHRELEAALREARAAAVTEGRAAGFREGFEKGAAEGRRLGFEQGRREGLEAGRTKARKELAGAVELVLAVARRLLKRDLAPPESPVTLQQHPRGAAAVGEALCGQPLWAERTTEAQLEPIERAVLDWRPGTPAAGGGR